ncbi:MAG: DUF362 domain-containing protein [Oscillospiraceae bacterium]|jgi:uncharacterized protein (DUF362 family)|nr:DUF362 domain-containing protein [Oscillospiraceae bacterium]
MAKATVYLVSTDDRSVGARRCLDFFGVPDYSGKTVYVKPNFNTADPAPGSTHNDTLEALLAAVRAANPKTITLGERSGPADAAQVFAQRGIPALCEKYGTELLNLEKLPPDGWVKIERPDLHWAGGYFEVPRALLDADAVVATCCLKTHGFGGVYSNSLKLAVGFTPKDMGRLHTPDIRKLIAEINLAYTPDFVLSDAVEVFTDGGPMSGTRRNANLMLISSDRIALDAVGLAILKNLGSNAAIMDTPIFAQDQIARAVELNLGVSSPDEIEIVTDDDASEQIAAQVREVLARG